MNDDFGKRLRRLRESHGMKIEELAQIMLIGRSNLGHIENGRVTPNIDFLIRVCEHFDVSADDLLGLNRPNAYNTESTNETIKYLEQQVKSLKEAIKNLVNGW